MKSTKPGQRRVLSVSDLFANPSNFLALGFGAGLVPIAPGTCGTIIALPFMWALYHAGAWLYALVILLALFAGIGICRRAAESFAGKSTNALHDHPAIVWDEIVGMWIALWLIPLSWQTILLGFILFRLFDIVKPWPICLIDRRIKGGLGIMLDDVVAGIFANLVLRLLLPYLSA